MSGKAFRQPNQPLRIFLAFIFLFNLLATLLPPGSVLAASTTSRQTAPASLNNSPAATTCTVPSPLTSTLTYLGPNTGFYSSTLGLAALLTDTSGNPLAGKDLVFSLGSQSGSATTDANGFARFNVLPAGTPGTTSATINFAGDSSYSATTISKSLNIAKAPTTLNYTGSLSGTTVPQQPVSAILRDANTGVGLAGLSVQFSLGSASATATTNAQGEASATLALSPDQAAGGLPLVITYAGDTYRESSQLSVPASRYLPVSFGSVVVRHAPSFSSNSRVEGSIRQLSGEWVTFNSGAVVTGDLLVPGSPTVQINGSLTFGGIITGTGSPQPANYGVTFNSGSQLGHLVVRTDPINLSNVPNPPGPTGTRDVNINSPGASIGDPTTLRGLNLNANVGAIAVPPGTYGQFTANDGSSFVFGVAGSTQPVVYNLQGLNINGTASLQVVGPVVVNLPYGISFNNQMGSSANPLWLNLNIASGGLTLNSGSSFYGTVRAPAGSVILNGGTIFKGSIYADRLNFNSGSTALVQGITVPTNPAPSLTAVQSGPTSVAPGQSFSYSLGITNTSASVSATNLTAKEAFTGSTPVTSSAALGTLLAGSSVITTFAQTAPAVLARQSGESDSAYLGRLGATDGQVLRASGNITYTDDPGQEYPPLNVTATTRLKLPLLSIGLTAPYCVSPGEIVSYTVRTANLGSAQSVSGTLNLTFPDNTTSSLELTNLAAGGSTTNTVSWTVPANQPEGPISTSVNVTWKDSAQNIYGPVGTQLTSLVGVAAGHPGTPTLLFRTNPGGAQAGLPFLTQPVVVKLLADGSVDNGYNGPITLTLKSGTGTAGAVLSGSTSVNAVNGVATFSGLSINLVGTGYILTAQAASSAGLGPVDSAAFNVITAKDGPATIISWSGGGQTTDTGSAFASPLQAKVLDGNGNPVSGASVTFSVMEANPGAAATFSGNQTTMAAATNGSGLATSSQLTANGTVGTFRVKATTTGVSSSADFVLNNTSPAAQAQGVTIQLNPVVSGPNPLNTSVTLTATVLRADVTPLSGQTVQFTVTGANPSTFNGTTDQNGKVSFTYSGALTGTDTVVANATVGGIALQSNSATVYWLNPANPVTTDPLTGRFFSNPENGCSFSRTLADTPVFTQTFPNLNFGDNRPWYTIPRDANGNPEAPIYAQGNGYQAGTGDLSNFYTGFTGSLRVSAAGNVTFDFYVDDGFILGVGNNGDPANQPTFVSGSGVTGYNPPTRKTTFSNLDWLADYDAPSGPTGRSATIYFPAPGIYPYEIDYTECKYGNVVLIMNVSGGGTGLISPASVTISPSSVSDPVNVDQSLTFTTTVKDATGNPVGSGQPVNLQVNGANGQTLTAQTDAQGIATFSFSGAISGTDTVQAVAWVKGVVASSSQVTVQWVGGNGGSTGSETSNYPAGCNYPIVTPGWLNNPPDSKHISGTLAITAQRDMAAGTVIDYWPASDIDSRRAIATTSQNIQAGTPLASLDTTGLKDGSYIIRMCGSDTSNNQGSSLSLITVVGENKPGRVAFSLTDVTVPVAGLPVVIGRTYDSLDRSTIGDFGYGWNLSISSPKLEVNPAGDVTLTLLDGKRVTFFFTPSSSIFGFGAPIYTPEAGVYGSLSQSDCGAVAPAGSSGGYICFPGGRFDPSSYDYRDPYGRVYTIARDSGGKFKLTKLADLNGNILTFDDTGISSSSLQGSLGKLVQFNRNSNSDATCPNCIQTITVLNQPGQVFTYTNNTGDLTGVTLPQSMPGSSDPISLTYSYFSAADGINFAHLFKGAVDPRGNTVVTSSYYPDGKLKEVAQPINATLSYTTSYGYDQTHNITIITNTDGTTSSTQSSQTDAYGKVISETQQVAAGVYRTTQYGYNASHQMTSRTANDGSVTTYTYDQFGNQSGVSDPLNHSTATVYNPYGGPLSITDPVNHTWNVGYNENFLPTVVADSLGSAGGYTFEARGSILSRNDGNGKVTSFTYDQYGNKVSETDPLGHTTLYAYDNLGRMTVMTDALGTATLNQYDGLGRVVTTNSAYNTASPVSTTYSYDANGNKAAETDALGRATSYTYDAANRLIKTTYPAVNGVIYSTTTTYDWRGNKVTQTDQAGHQTRYAYNLAGELVSTTGGLDSNGNATAETTTSVYEYDNIGRKVREYNPYAGSGSLPANQPFTGYQFDPAGRLITQTNQLGYQTVYTYDAAGHKLSDTDPNSNTTSYHFDTRGRLDKTTYPNDSNGQPISTTQSYDGAGNLLTKTDAAGKTTTYGYDDASRLLSVTNPMSQPTSYNYDVLGRLKTIIDANQHTTGFEYDILGRQTKKIWPDNSFEQYGYDLLGNQTSLRLSDGTTNTFAYDEWNRLKTATFAASGSVAGRTVSYTYTPTGQRYQVTDSNQGATPVTYGYDNLNRPTSITQPGGNAVSYSYDALGNRNTLTTNVGGVVNIVQYSYSPVNQLLSVTAPTDPTGQHTTYTYDPAGRRQQQNLPNGVMVQFGYDNLNRLLTINQSKNAVPIASYTYTLDKAGNRTGVSEGSGRTVSWSYDNAYRLTGEVDSLSPGFTTSYGYDGVGNRLSLSVSNGTTSTVTSSTYNELDQLTGVVGPGQSLSYSYVRGNLVQVKDNTTNTTQQSYTWDSADRLVGATVSSGSATYAYDADNRRVKQTASGVVTDYLWDETSAYGDVLVETDGSNVIQTSYILGNGELISQRRVSATTPEYYLKDGQGSVRNLTDSTGSMVSGQNYTYDAFGNLKSGQTSPTSNYLYTGQQFDNLTGLYDLRARYYKPNDGRFLNRDQASINTHNPLELNRYVYTANNPINSIDPSGYAAAIAKSGSGSSEYGMLIGTIVGFGLGAAYLGTKALGIDVEELIIWFFLTLSYKVINAIADEIQDIVKSRNITIVAALPKLRTDRAPLTSVTGGYVPALTVYFTGGISDPFLITQAIAKIIEKVGLGRGYFDASWGGDSQEHAERLMAGLLRNLNSSGLLDTSKPRIYGIVINEFCVTCQVRVQSNGNGGKWTKWSINTAPEVTLWLGDKWVWLGERPH